MINAILIAQERRRAEHAAILRAHREKTQHTPPEFFALGDWITHTSWCTKNDGTTCNCGLDEAEDRMYAWFRARGTTP